ncbi:MAG: SGNH/GDSL hydrolase family protein [Lentisphaeria bacterium]
MKREEIEWCQLYWYDTSKENLPRVLLIGDSIIKGCNETVVSLLKDQYTIGTYATSKIVGDSAYLPELKLMLADYPIKLIYFNNGLHGFTQNDEFYKNGLIEVVQFLQKNTTAKLIWRNSTPITEKDNPQKLAENNDIVLRRNKIAADIMKKYNIPIDDIYNEVVDKPEYKLNDCYHFTKEGFDLIADFIAKKIRHYLS